MKTILLTGATTFLGQELCQHFLNQGYEVLAVSRRTRSLRREHPKLTWLTMDLSRPQSPLAVALAPHGAHIRSILHVSADGPPDASYADLYRRHVLSTAHLLELARGFPQLEHFFLISTLDVGGHRDSLLPECWPSIGSPLDPAAQSRAAAESLFAASELPCGRSILRVAEIVGHSQTGYSPALSGSLQLLVSLQKILRWRSLWQRAIFFPFPFDEGARLALLPVDEAAETIVQLVPRLQTQSDLQVLHLAGYEGGVSVRQLLRFMLEHYGVDLEPLPLPLRFCPPLLLRQLGLTPQMHDLLQHRTRYEAQRVRTLLPELRYSHPRQWQARLLEYAAGRLESTSGGAR